MNIIDCDIENAKIIKRVANYLQIEVPLKCNINLKEEIKRLCILRLCKSIGLSSKYNYTSNFFKNFSSIAGEAISQTLNLHLTIAEDKIRLFKYNKMNLVEKFIEYLDEDNMDESFIDLFLFFDKYQDLLKT